MKLDPRDKVLIDGQLVDIGEKIARSFSEGDRLLSVPSSGLLLIPRTEIDIVRSCVNTATEAFKALSAASSKQIANFYSGFARRLGDETIFKQIRVVNDHDVATAQASGRSTTRLALSDVMRQDMIDALHIWESLATPNTALETIAHDGWTIESHVAPLGVVGFVFEGRPNVFADATGVLRTRNVCVFRIGSDAYETAQAIMNLAVIPSLADAGLPTGSVVLLPSKTHACAWALFSDRRLSLAVARGSGAAVALLGEIAQQHGIPASLHGTGGAWMVVSRSANLEYVRNVVQFSLDRKVCNTLNTVVMTRSDLAHNVQAVIDGIAQAAKLRNTHAIIHADEVVREALTLCVVPADCKIEPIDHESLGTEWEWENSPEVAIVATDSVQSAVDLFNRFSPAFVLSVVSDDDQEIENAWLLSNAPFFGDGMTRWVDGQYALRKPELGLSNWQNGRTFARGGILSGDSIFTLRYRVRQTDSKVKR
ncbi:MAG: aldehyde dehydrogenase family protein [Actinomycetota bacterium]